MTDKIPGFMFSDDITDYIRINELKVKDGGTLFSNVEYYGRRLLLDFFQKTGFFTEVRTKYNSNDIKKKIRLSPKYEKLFEIMIVILEKEGYIRIDNDIMTLTQKAADLPAISNLGEHKAKMIEQYPDMKCHFNLLDICITSYEKILTGEKSPDGIMFPVYSTELVDGIFRDNMLSDYFNVLISMITSGYVIDHKKINNDRNVKILEIGAGTGGTSIFVLDGLQNIPGCEYYFTDISKVFIRNFEKKQKTKFPFAVFKRLNIEEDISKQEFNLNDFDVIIASNVIHSTKNISHTLTQVKSLMRDDGIFLLNEVTRNQDFTSLTFGLLEGWWMFTDADIRLPYSPLLDIERWQSIIKKCGFKNSTLVSSSDKEAPDSFSQSLFLVQ